ncbi:MAG: NAD(P)-binding domain-containing protein [Bdellovibrionales bacterium]|nr:NAD(P)-binding domain-containing protein [Bdellovibrionales bacterium]
MPHPFSSLQSKNIGFIGCGNLAQAIMGALIETKTVSAQKIFVSNRSEGKLQKAASQFGVNICSTNEEIVDQCDIIFLATKPQDLFQAIEPIAMSFDDHHMVISLATGIHLKKIESVLTPVKMIARVMMNTPARIRRAVIGYQITPRPLRTTQWIEDLLSPLGYMVEIKDDEQMSALAVATSAGTGFVFELMNYWVDWLEGYGFDSAVAEKMTIETFLGAALLADFQPNLTIEELQAQVTSKKGITAAGLESMRELDLERGMRISFEKAQLRDKDLGELMSSSG